jgi:sulfite reductase (ferredoxin)
LPQFLGRVLERYAAYKAVSAEPVDFGRFWKSKGRVFVTALCTDHYNSIPTMEEDRRYYYDHGSKELFSTRNISGEAECSAGIYDMISVDEKAVRSNLEKIAASNNEPSANDSILRETLFLTTRMLLVTRGEEAVVEQEAYRLFIKHFIDRRLIAEAHRAIVQIALDPQQSLTLHADAVTSLAESVLHLYRRMDDTMRFPGEAPLDEQARSQPTPAIDAATENRGRPDRFKDLRGVRCPINFAQTKIQLAGMQKGEVLEILLDDGDPIDNVPGSVRLEGHDLLGQVRMDDAYWSVVIRKA